MDDLGRGKSLNRRRRTLLRDVFRAAMEGNASLPDELLDRVEELGWPRNVSPHRPAEVTGPTAIPGGVMVTEAQRRIIDAVIGVFETGAVGGGDPSMTTLLADGAGITYGMHQATDHRDTLDEIVLEYIHQGGIYAADLSVYVPRLAANETAKIDPKNQPSWLVSLMSILRRAGAEDPLMRKAQEAVFGRLYWEPAAAYGRDLELVYPLSYLVLYDTTIHSGLSGISVIRKRFAERPPSASGDEQAWTSAYVRARRAWLASFVGKDADHTALVRRTTYRMDTVLQLIADDNWQLSPPISVIGRTISV